MKKKALVIFVMMFFFLTGTAGALTVFDPLNYALNEIQKTIMETQWARDIALAMERLEQLKATYTEIIRFNEGIDEFVQSLIGDPLGRMFGSHIKDLSGAYEDSSWVLPHIEVLEQSDNFTDVRNALEEITGTDPRSPERPYITFEDYQVTQGFRLAQEIRDAGEITRDVADHYRAQARAASPKGAARITAGATAELIALGQQEQEALAKLIELTATSVEQKSREEKLLEHQRLKYLRDVNELIGGIVRP
jgi:hypothetical protein